LQRYSVAPRAFAFSTSSGSDEELNITTGSELQPALESVSVCGLGFGQFTATILPDRAVIINGMAVASAMTLAQATTVVGATTIASGSTFAAASVLAAGTIVF